MDLFSVKHEKRITAIAANVKKGIRDWFVTMSSLGMHEEDFQKWQDELQGELEACISECNQIAQEKQHGLIEKIELLLQTSEQLCKTLNIKMPQITSTGKGLYSDEQYLINQIKVWQDEITLRSSEIEVIKSRRDAICAALGTKPFIIKESPLPSREVVAVYERTVQELETERCHRMVTFMTLQKKCATLAKDIEFVPNLNFEKNIVTGNNLDDIQLNEANMQRTKDLHNDLVIKRENIVMDLFTLRENVIDLWRILEEDVKYCNDFTKDYFRTNMTTLNAFRREVKRCEDLRTANLKTFIVKHRETLVDLWNQAGYSQAKRDKFRHHMEDDCYTEGLLTLHDSEIERVRHQLTSNQKLYEVLKKRETLYAKLRDLEQRANAPDRYKNRGGQLLKEEKARKVVTMKIPMIEEQLLELAVNYEMTHGEKFQYGNDDIESLIARDRENIEQAPRHIETHKRQFPLAVSRTSSMETINLCAAWEYNRHNSLPVTVESNESIFQVTSGTPRPRKLHYPTVSTCSKLENINYVSMLDITATPRMSKSKTVLKEVASAPPLRPSNKASRESKIARLLLPTFDTPAPTTKSKIPVRRTSLSLSPRPLLSSTQTHEPTTPQYTSTPRNRDYSLKTMKPLANECIKLKSCNKENVAPRRKDSKTIKSSFLNLNT